MLKCIKNFLENILKRVKMKKALLNNIENKLRSMRTLAVFIRDNHVSLSKSECEQIKQEYNALKKEVKLLEQELKKIE